jgi:hypothetical protein
MPLFGFFALVISFVFTSLFIPEACEEAGALRLPATILSIGLLLPLVLSFVAAPKSAFHALNIVAAAPVYWLLLDLIQGAYGLAGISGSDVINSFTAIALFSGCVWLGGMVAPLKEPRQLRSGLSLHLSDRQLSIMVWLAFGLAFLKFAIPAKFDLIAMAGAFGGNRWAKPWGRGTLGGWDAFLDHFAYFGYILPVLTSLLARRVGWFHYRTLIAISLTFIIAALLSVGGGRRIIGVLVGSGLTVWFLSDPLPRLRSMIGVALTAIALLFLMQVILLYRNDGLANVFSGDFEDRISERQYLHVDDNFLRLTQLTQIMPENHPHVEFQWLVWVAARPVPRVLWPGKPISPGFNLPEYLGKEGVSYSSSIVGELYMAFGFVGCGVGGLFFGWLAVSLTSIFERYSSPGTFIVYGLGTLALFAGMRSGIDLILMSYGIFGWFLIVGFYRSFTGQVESNDK